MNWKFLVRMCLPMLEMAGEEYKAKDENDSGRDDITGAALVFAAQLIRAVLDDKKLPKVPESLQ